MTTEQTDIIGQAIDWHLRLAEGGEADWAAFIDWLEQSPDNARAYDAVARQNRAIDLAHFLTPMPVGDNDNPSRRRWPWAAGGVAAAVIAALITPIALTPRPEPYVIATQPGQHRAVTLVDGSRIDVSGGTILRLDHANPRTAMLDRGEALFNVRHDDRRPFTVSVNGVTIRDVGTVFNVSRTDTEIGVAIAEGSVLYQPQDEALTLRAGDALARDKDGRIVRSNVDPGSVGGWRTGTLSFNGLPLREVAATLNRLYRINLSIEGSLSARPFTGMIHLTGAADRDIPHLAALIGASSRRDGTRWILSGDAPAAR